MGMINKTKWVKCRKYVKELWGTTSNTQVNNNQRVKRISWAPCAYLEPRGCAAFWISRRLYWPYLDDGKNEERKRKIQ